MISTMRWQWLCPADAEKSEVFTQDRPAQGIVFVSPGRAAARLSSAWAAAQEDGLGPVLRGVGLLDGVPFTVTSPADPAAREEATLEIATPYREGTPDWKTVEHFIPLLHEAEIGRFVRVTSRCAAPEAVVCRRDPRGFFAPLYEAASQTEADEFRLFLEKNFGTSSGDYRVLPPEPAVDWVIRDAAGSDRAALGRYRSRAVALDVACRMSGGGRNELRVVPERGTFESYRVLNGHVSLAGWKKVRAG
jgi:hypothetical protein